MPRNETSSDTVTRSKSNSKGNTHNATVNTTLSSSLSSSSSSSRDSGGPLKNSSALTTPGTSTVLPSITSSSSSGTMATRKRTRESTPLATESTLVSRSDDLSRSRNKHDSGKNDGENRNDDDDNEKEENDEEDQQSIDDDDIDNDIDDDDDNEDDEDHESSHNPSSSSSSSSNRKSSTNVSFSSRRSYSTNVHSTKQHPSSSTALTVPSNVDAPAFLRKTYNLVNDPTVEQVITWSTDGTRIVICNVSAMETVILPKFFKHSNFSSFVRQLNMYGFSKVSTKGSLQNYIPNHIIHKLTNNNIPLNNVRIFYHPLFQQYQPELLAQIKRKGAIATQGTNDDHTHHNGMMMNDGGDDGDDNNSVTENTTGGLSHHRHHHSTHPSSAHHHHEESSSSSSSSSSRHPHPSSSSSGSSSTTVTMDMWQTMNKRLHQLEQQVSTSNQTIEEMQHYMRTFQYSYDRVIMGLYIALQGANIQCSIGIHPLTHLIILRFQSLENKYMMNETTPMNSNSNTQTTSTTKDSPRLTNSGQHYPPNDSATTSTAMHPPAVSDSTNSSSTIDNASTIVPSNVPLDFEHILLYHEFYNLCLNQHPMLFSGTNNIIRNIFEQYQQSLVASMSTARTMPTNATKNDNNNNNNNNTTTGSYVTSFASSLCIDVPLTNEPVPRSLLHEAFPSGHLLEYLTNTSNTGSSSLSSASSSSSNDGSVHPHSSNLLDSSPLSALIATIENTQQPYPPFTFPSSHPSSGDANTGIIHIKMNQGNPGNNQRNYLTNHHHPSSSYHPSQQRSIEYIPSYENSNGSNDNHHYHHPSSSLPPIKVPGRNPYMTNENSGTAYNDASSSSFTDNDTLYPHVPKRSRSTTYDRYHNNNYNNNNTNTYGHTQSNSKRNRTSNIPLESPRPPELYTTNTNAASSMMVPSQSSYLPMQNNHHNGSNNSNVLSSLTMDYTNNSAPMRLDSFYSTTPTNSMTTLTMGGGSDGRNLSTHPIHTDGGAFGGSNGSGSSNIMDGSRNSSSNSSGTNLSTSGVGRLYSFNSFTLDGNGSNNTNSSNDNHYHHPTIPNDPSSSGTYLNNNNNNSVNTNMNTISPGTTMYYTGNALGPSSSPSTVGSTTLIPSYPVLHPQTSFLPGLRRSSTTLSNGNGGSNGGNGNANEEMMSPFPSSTSGIGNIMMTTNTSSHHSVISPNLQGMSGTTTSSSNNNGPFMSSGEPNGNTATSGSGLPTDLSFFSPGMLPISSVTPTPQAQGSTTSHTN